MKNIFVIIDGASDKPGFGYKTPYQRAIKRNLDYFALNGKTGMHYPIDSKTAPESDVAITALLGYDPYRYFVGRGPLEALGAGMKLKGKNFVAFRCNFATVSDKYKLFDRRAGRTLTTDEAKELADYLNKKIALPVPFKFISTTEHRGVLVLFGRLSDNVSNVDPAYERKGKFGVARLFAQKLEFCKALDKSALAKKTANIVNMFVHQSHLLLDIHPVNDVRRKRKLKAANIVLVRDAGNKLPETPKKKRWAAITGMPLEKGISSAAGMKVLSFEYLKIEGPDLKKQAISVLETEIKWSKILLKKNYKKFESFYIHIKPIDVAGHDGDAEMKTRMIEILDKKFFSWLKKFKNFKLIVTSDHSTPCRLKMHSADPVPLLIYDSSEKLKGTKFDEVSCRKGSVGLIYGKDVLKLFD